MRLTPLHTNDRHGGRVEVDCDDLRASLIAIGDDSRLHAGVAAGRAAAEAEAIEEHLARSTAPGVEAG